jgi:hypothetical protein
MLRQRQPQERHEQAENTIRAKHEAESPSAAVRRRQAQAQRLGRRLSAQNEKTALQVTIPRAWLETSSALLWTPPTINP